MMFGSRLPLKHLADWCRSLSSALGAGVALMKALQLSSRRGRPEVRRVADEILVELKQGHDFARAVELHQHRFPPLFVAMADVANSTGHLPEVLKELESFFRFQLRLRRQFLSQIFWPVFQLIAAILIIALVIFIIGILGNQLDILGLGLSGPTGAMVWLTCSFGSMAAVAILYWSARTVLGQMQLVDSILLRIPVLGPALQMLALSRLCFAMHMTLDSGMSVHEAIDLSLAATDNGAFTRVAPAIRDDIRSGNQLQHAFSQHAVFPDDFLEILATGEETGSVPEQMRRLSDQYNEQAEHRLAMLNTAAGWLVWSIVAGIIIFFIFRIFSTYVSMLNSYL